MGGGVAIRSIGENDDIDALITCRHLLEFVRNVVDK